MYAMATPKSGRKGGVAGKLVADVNWQSSYPIGQLPKSVMDALPTRAMQAKGMPLITLTPAEFITRQRSVSEWFRTERKYTPVVTVACTHLA